MRGVLGRVLVGGLVAVASTTGGVAAAPAVQESPDSVVLDVELEPDGNASWRVAYRYRLADNESEAAFESLRADVRNDTERYEERFADRMRLTLRDAENTTGREMSLLNVTVSTKRVQLPQEYGVVVYRFEWTAFADVEGDRVRAGDALAGLFLEEGTSLSFAWPEGYRATDAAPAPDREEGRSVYWAGPRDFGEGDPRLELAPGTPTPRPTDATTTTDGGAGSGNWLGGVALGAALAVVLRRGQGEKASVADDGLRTNEEQVLGLLEERGGRLKQQEVASELGWTDARTSKVVRGLREDGEVEVVRLGRENVVALPGELDT